MKKISKQDYFIKFNLWFIIVSGIIILFTSCITPMQVIPNLKRTYEDVQLNTVLRAEIGDKLVLKGEEEYQKAFKILTTPDFKFNTVKFPYKSGDVLPLKASNKNWYLYYTDNDSGAMYIGIAQNKSNLNEIKPFAITMSGNSYKNFKDKSVFQVEETTSASFQCNHCYKQEFIYNGKVDNNLKFIYREYIDDMARPAFNQDLQYDLNEGNIIGFKGLRLEIFNTTNTFIAYRVIQNFDNIR